MKLILIGAGGAAHHGYVPILQLLRHKVSEVHLFDGDTYDKANISRQALAIGGLGKNKAEVMAEYLHTNTLIYVTAQPTWFYCGFPVPDMGSNDLIVCMADNHKARREARNLARARRSWLVSCACETRSGEAWIYHPSYDDDPWNPFNLYPELETEDGDDPMRRATGCASEQAFDNNPQTPYGNALSAAMAVYLINNTFLSNEKFKETNPVVASFTGTTLSTIRPCDYATNADASR